MQYGAVCITPLRAGEPVDEELLHKIQSRRLPPTKMTQAVQLQIQKRVIANTLSQTGNAPTMPTLLRFLLRFLAVRRIPARVIGYGFRQEHVHTAIGPPAV